MCLKIIKLKNPEFSDNDKWQIGEQDPVVFYYKLDQSKEISRLAFNAIAKVEWSNAQNGPLHKNSTCKESKSG